MKKLITLMFVFTLFSGQLVAQTKKELKQEKAQKEYEALKTLINLKEYVFDATWISTSRGRRINISAGSNSIIVKQDSTKAAMQFFGEVYSLRSTSGEGVAFDNVMENYQVKFDDKKRRISISFNVKNKSETYGVFISVNKTGYAYVDIYSNNKSNVTYDGNLSAIKKE